MGFLHHNDLRHATTEAKLKGVAIPKKTRTYQPLPHGQIIRWVRELCKENGLEVARADYIEGNSGKQMGGFFHIKPENKQLAGDDLLYQLAVINSYDKSIRATAAAGATVVVCSNGMLLAEDFIKRRHQGQVGASFKDFLAHTLGKQEETMRQLAFQKAQYREQPLSQREMAQLAGQLFIEERMLNSWEMNELRKQITAPTFDYGGENRSAWEFYNHVTHALKNSGPTEYQSKQRDFNRFMAEEFELYAEAE